MAAKKKAAPKKAPAAKKVVAKKSVAVATLARLPALTGKLRAAFRNAYSDEQCDAWGQQTKAEHVIAEASKFIATMERAVKDQTDSLYSRRRLTYLAELVVLLEDEVAHTTQDATEQSERRSVRNAALEVANNARRDLARRLRAMAGGNAKILADIAALSPTSENSPSDVQDSLTATIDLGQRARRDQVMETLADDVGLTEARLNSAYAALEALTGARDVAMNAAAYEGDAPSVNRIEGRVLREMRLAQRLFKESREHGVNLPNLVAGPSLKAIFGPKGVDEPAAAPAAPPAG
ncbi:MAG: hypothetical protein U0228_17930 [Myxococcaceae bacterium]